jgi:uncharacterized protein (TIGR03083 family)
MMVDGMVESRAASFPPILTAHLFEDLDNRLLVLLRSLSPDDWRRPTIVPKWNVHQVAAHLLDTALRRLSFGRDEGQGKVEALSDEELAELVNRLNAQGVEVYGRLSPRMLISLCEVTLPQLREYLLSLDPMAPSRIAVSWAGEPESQNWFDVARELTERWHHQQQIRLAVGQPGIMTPRLYSPVLDCFMRGLPYAYRKLDAPQGAIVEITVTGKCGDTWWLRRQEEGWSLVAHPEGGDIVARAALPQEIAWRVFTRGIDRAEALGQTSLAGDERLGRGVLDMLAIVG